MMTTKDSEAVRAYTSDRRTLSRSGRDRPNPIDEFEDDGRDTFFEIFSDGSLLITSFEIYGKTDLPRHWEGRTWRELSVFKAGMAYLADSGRSIGRPKPITELTSNHSWYEIFSDGSLLFTSVYSDNEVWEDWTVFITDHLLPEIYTSLDPTWDSLSKMDREILLRYCGGDETEARKLLETER